jgi:SAM-dependent methyltransferase
MSFEVAADSYDRFMGRYSRPLAVRFADFAGVAAGQRVVDVGCGPGSLVAELVDRIGVEAVSAVDPSVQFVAAARERFPDVEILQAAAESLPFVDGWFDSAMAQLVVHFMSEPITGIREMARVVTSGGIVAGCVWDNEGARSPLEVFWASARALDPTLQDESERPGTREGHLVELFEAAGLSDVSGTLLTVVVEHQTFEEWWEPFTLGVGPAGVYVSALQPEQREALRQTCFEAIPTAPFQISAGAWAARGRKVES